MRAAARSIALAAALIVAACGQSAPTVVDGASKEAAEASIAALGAALPPAAREDFEIAIEMGWPLAEIAGKTPAEIVAMARARRIAELRDTEIPALEAKVAEAEAAIATARRTEASAPRFLAALELVNPQFVWRPGANGEAEPLLSFNLRNGSSEAIQTLVFRATIGAKGAAKPWIDERFTFKFAEAVTTGETKFVFVTPDLAQPGNADAQDSRIEPDGGYAYGIDFVRVEDLNGRAIMDDEGVEKAEAALAAAEAALAAAETEAKRLEAGGALAR